MLVNISCDDRLPEQVTSADSDSPDGSVGVEEPHRIAHVVSSSVIESEAAVDVCLNSYDDALPRHVLQAYAKSPTIAPIGEIHIYSVDKVHRPGAYSHPGPAALGVQHRAVPDISEPRGDSADLVDADRPLPIREKGARLRLSDIGPRISALETDNHAVPLVLASELTAANHSERGE